MRFWIGSILCVLVLSVAISCAPPIAELPEGSSGNEVAGQTEKTTGGQESNNTEDPADVKQEAPASDDRPDASDTDRAGGPDETSSDTDMTESKASCRTDEIRCDGSCVNPETDTQHCGNCGNQCESGELCKAGSCVPPCSGGQVVCGAGCVELALLPPSLRLRFSCPPPLVLSASFYPAD